MLRLYPISHTNVLSSANYPKACKVSLPNKLLPGNLVNADLSDLVLKQVAGRSAETDRTGFIFRGHALGVTRVINLGSSKTAATAQLSTNAEYHPIIELAKFG